MNHSALLILLVWFWFWCSLFPFNVQSGRRGSGKWCQVAQVLICKGLLSIINNHTHGNIHQFTTAMFFQGSEKAYKCNWIQNYTNPIASFLFKLLDRKGKWIIACSCWPQSIVKEQGMDGWMDGWSPSFLLRHMKYFQSKLVTDLGVIERRPRIWNFIFINWLGA